MLGLLMKLAERSPAIRRFLWLRWYQYLAGYDEREWHFMNYGYQTAVAEDEPRKLQPADEPNRYSIQLYDRVAGAVDLRGKALLEVGSGRGGGSSFVHRYHHPTQTTGLDFSAKAVKFCRARHHYAGLEFAHGDAEHMPFADDSFDAVLNVESSHCYGSMPRFVAEVARVLRPEGHFLFADFRTPAMAEQLRQLFAESNLEIVERETITDNVLRALSLDSERKLSLLEKAAPKRMLGTLRRFAAIEGSDVYESFANGTFVYERYALRKGA
mgnify:CR=1 FL=1